MIFGIFQIFPLNPILYCPKVDNGLNLTYVYIDIFFLLRYPFIYFL